MSYHGQFELDKFLNEQYIKNAKGGFFVECGVYDGIEESTCLFFEDELEWRGINIECVPFLFDSLIKNRPNSINLDSALSNKKELKTFTHVLHPERGVFFGNGSFKHNKDHIEYLLSIGCTFEKFEVQCNTFKNLWDKIVNKTDIDLFVLDVEGGELEAIDGILKMAKKYYPKIFCIEHSHCGLNKIDEKLRKHYIFSQQYHQNAIFLRNF